MATLHDQPISYPSRGILKLADRFGMPLLVTVFALGAGFAVIHEGTTYALLIGFGWLVLTSVALQIWLYLARCLQRQSRWSQLIQRLPPSTRGTVVIATSALLVLAVAPLPAANMLSLYLWPLFIPGVVVSTMTLRMSPLAHTSHWISGLTRRILCYMGLAALLLIILAMPELAVRLRQVARIHSIFDGLGLLFNLAVLFVPAAWAAIAMGMTYYSLRRADLDRMQADVLLEINHALAHLEDPLKALPQIARILYNSLPFEQTWILIPDESYRITMAVRAPAPPWRPTFVPPECSFHVAAGIGPRTEGVLGTTFSMMSGIAHRAMVTRTAQIVRDVTKDMDYEAGGVTGVGSELSVPVFNLDRPDMLLALVVVQDAQLDTFSQRDSHLLERVGQDIAIASLRNAVNYRDLQNELEKLTHLNDFPRMVHQVLDSGRRLFTTPWVALVSLGLGTSVPLRGQTYLALDAFHEPTFLDRDQLRAEITGIPQMIISWHPLFLDFAAQEDQDATSWVHWQPWAKREGIGAIALLPIGTQKEPLGLLLIGFVHLYKGFRPSLQLWLASFAQAVAPALTMTHYQEALYQSFLRPKIESHRILREEGLARGQLDELLIDLDDMPKFQLQQRLLHLHRAVRRLARAEVTPLPDFTNDTLHKALLEYRAALTERQDYKCYIEYRLHPPTDFEKSDLNLILYRVITEAILNAVTHGQAEAVYVRLARLRDRLLLTVADNGIGFDRLTLLNREIEPAGILDLIRCMENYCGLESFTWAWTAPGRGTCLHLVMPLLSDSTSPAEVYIIDWLDHMYDLPPWEAAREIPDRQTLDATYPRGDRALPANDHNDEELR